MSDNDSMDECPWDCEHRRNGFIHAIRDPPSSHLQATRGSNAYYRRRLRRCEICDRPLASQNSQTRNVCGPCYRGLTL